MRYPEGSSQTLERDHLAQAVKQAAGILSGSSFAQVQASSGTSPDWRRLLSGEPLTPSDIDADMAVKRRIVTSEGEVDLEAMPAWLLSRVKRVVLLTAEAGEGKSTYKNLLIRALTGRFVILEWDVRHSGASDYRLLWKFHDNLRTFLPRGVQETLPPEEPPFIIISEITGGVRGPLADNVSVALAARETDPDPSVVFLTGRPAELRPLQNRFSADLVQLAALSQTEAADLRARIDRGYRAISGGLSTDVLRMRYPNLPLFLNSPSEKQLALLTEHGKPLLASLLEAIYGDMFWKRLTGELELLADSDKRAYVHVSLATSAGASVPEELLTKLVPAAEVDERSRRDPWIRDERGHHRARHRVIAQTVLEESHAHALLRQSLSDWIGVLQGGGVGAELTWRIFDQATNWIPTAPDRGSEFRGVIRRLAREAIKSSAGFVDTLKTTIGADVGSCLLWANTLHALVPDKPTADHLYLLEANKALLELAQVLSDDSTSLRERIQYYLDKNKRDTARAKGQRESVADLEERVRNWESMAGHSWCGPDFHADLFMAARELARTLTVGETQEPKDSDILFQAYSTAVTSFESLRAQVGDSESLKPRAIEYSELVGRLVHFALPIRRTEILRFAWDFSVSKGNPNARTGTQYADILQNQGDREAAQGILRAILHSRPSWGDAVYRLARLAMTEDERDEVRQCLFAALSTNPTGLSLALLNHAAALMEPNSELRIPYLRQAIESYAQFIRSIDEWESRGPMWQEACKELRRLTREPAPDCGKRLEEARKQLGGTIR